MKNYQITERVRSKLSFWTPVLQLIMLTATMIAGLAALNYYRNANRASVNNTLLTMDEKIYDIVSPETTYLFSALYFDISENVSAKEKADIMLRNIAGDSISLSWTTIPELYEAIMALGRQSFNKNNLDCYHRLLSGIAISEKILFLVYRAFCQYQYGIITKQDWRDYSEYISDFSQSPLFLCAVYINLQGKYIDDGFAAEIRKVYSETQIPLVESSYSEMLNKFK